MKQLGSGSGVKEENYEVEIVDGEVFGEKALWRAVITQALMDAGSLSSKREMKYHKAQAISWLSGTSPDFKQVCEMADMDYEYVREKAKQAIARGCSWRNSVKKPTRGKKVKCDKIYVGCDKDFKNKEVKSSNLAELVCL